MFDNITMMLLHLLVLLNDKTVSVEYSQFSKGVLWSCSVRGLKVDAYCSPEKMLVRGSPVLQEWLFDEFNLPNSSPQEIEDKSTKLLIKMEALKI